MILNYQGIIIDKKKQSHTAEYISNNQKNIKTSSSVKLLGVHVNDKLNFNLHVTNICRSAANQFHALINSYFYSNFKYCPLVWMFSSAKLLNKLETLQKRALRFLYEDYVLSYEELLQKAGRETMKVNRLRSLCTEIYKLINNINPMYMNEIFKLRKISRAVCSHYKLNLDVPTINQVSFGGKSPTGLKFGIHSLFT